MMQLKPILVPEWPKLAWVARFGPEAEEIEVLHGPMVEVCAEWAVEAVWAGEFTSGDFDQTDLVFGSGIRCRGGSVTFVSSGTTFDQLWHTSHGGAICVANSLPGLLAVTELRLRQDYPDYSRDMFSITRGLNSRTKSIPTESVPVASTYFHNLTFENGTLREVAKPDSASHFASYGDYHGFLTETARSLGVNMRDPLRRSRVASLSTISSGYDSSAAAAISRHAECTQTATIRDSTSLWRGTDSGRLVAKALDMSCAEYPRTAREFPLEKTIWAATGRCPDINVTQFDFPEPLATVFTGYHGDKVWARGNRDLSDPFVNCGHSGRGFSEFRLHRGFFHCCVPFWGFRHASELQAISCREEMLPWTLYTDYDRPIPRRIVEEAGVPRNTFGVLKKNTVLESSFCWPYSPDAREDFQAYLERRGMFAPSYSLAWLIRRAAQAETLFCRNVLAKFGISRRFQPWNRIKGTSLLFQWANDELKQKYRQGLREVQAKTSAPSEVLRP